MQPRLSSSVNIIGHGGASGHAPANTLASFEKGIHLGANVLELDLQLSKDGELVAIHDHILEHSTNGKGLVKDYTLKELKQLDAGIHFAQYQGTQKIPTLQEIFDLAKGKAQFAIDIKNGPVLYPGIEEKLVSLIEKNALVDEVIAISFYHPSLKRIKEINPQIRTGVVYNAGLLEPWNVAETVLADALHPKYFYPMPEIISEAHKRGYPVNPWTIDSTHEIEQWLRYGVDGITSNYPDVVRQVIEKLC